MARPALLLALFAVTALPAALAAQAFEGTLRMRTVTFDVTAVLEQYGNDPERLIAAPWERVLAAARAVDTEIDEDSAVYQIKGSRLRASGAGFDATSYMITDVKTGYLLMVQPEQRAYLEWTPGDMRKIMEEARAMAPEAQDPAAEFRPLGTTRELGGRRCGEYRMEKEQAITVACLTRDLADLATLFRQWGEQALSPGEEGRNELAALTRYGFPLLVREVTAEGDEETMSTAYEITELISIDRGTLPESLFTPPPGFRKTTLPGSP